MYIASDDRVTDKLERIWKEAVVTQFRYYSNICLEDWGHPWKTSWQTVSRRGFKSGNFPIKDYINSRWISLDMEPFSLVTFRSNILPSSSGSKSKSSEKPADLYYLSISMIEAVCFSETSGFYRIAWHHIPKILRFVVVTARISNSTFMKFVH
jgi:hypothetical protein